MKSVLLYSQHELDMQLQKINSNVYYNQKTDKFYRLNIMPSCTVFVGEDVDNRQIMSLTKYDPIFLMINILYQQRRLKQENVIQALKNKNWKVLSTIQNINSKQVYVYDQQKVYDFLQTKVIKLQKYFQEHNPLQRMKLLRLEPKWITSDTILLLKNQISSDIVTQFCKVRYTVAQSRKIVPQVQKSEVTKPKPSKNSKKVQKIQIAKGQTTLFSWGKK